MGGHESLNKSACVLGFMRSGPSKERRHTSPSAGGQVVGRRVGRQRSRERAGRLGAPSRCGGEVRNDNYGTIGPATLTDRVRGGADFGVTEKYANRSEWKRRVSSSHQDLLPIGQQRCTGEGVILLVLVRSIAKGAIQSQRQRYAFFPVEKVVELCDVVVEIDDGPFVAADGKIHERHLDCAAQRAGAIGIATALNGRMVGYAFFRHDAP